jgi:N-acyl homoserine lactone hydrolase
MTKVWLVQTGKVKVKQFQATGARSQISRLWQLLFTQKWSEWLPIYCWLIEHPAGPFLIDAGEIDRVTEPGFLPDSAIFRGAAKYEIHREDEVDKQLAKIGYSAEQIKGVFLTHFHSDHADGIYHFPKARIFASKAAYDFTIGSKGAGLGYFKKHLPEWFQPETFEFTHGKEGVFESSKKLLADGSIVAVPLPGHSIGHTGYIIKSDDYEYVFSGDTTFNGNTLKAGIPFTVLNNAACDESVRKVWNYARSSNVVVLCSHDPQIPKILDSISSK